MELWLCPVNNKRSGFSNSKTQMRNDQNKRLHVALDEYFFFFQK